MMLQDDEWSLWSDREIARRCCVHHDTVNRIRHALSVGNRQIEPESSRKVSRNGTTYVQNTSNIGKSAGKSTEQTPTVVTTAESDGYTSYETATPWPQEILVAEFSAVLRGISPTSNNISDLAQNISEVGLLQPITVREITTGLYRLICGHRRLLAVQSLGWQVIPSIVIASNPEDDNWMMLSENLQRDDLSEVEKAEKLHEMMDLSGDHLSTYKLASKLGLSQKYIYNLLKLHGYPAEIKEEIKAGNIGADTVRSINKLETPTEQTKVVSYAINNDLSRKQVDETVEVIKALPESIRSRLREEPQYDVRKRQVLPCLKHYISRLIIITNSSTMISSNFLPFFMNRL